MRLPLCISVYNRRFGAASPLCSDQNGILHMGLDRIARSTTQWGSTCLAVLHPPFKKNPDIITVTLPVLCYARARIPFECRTQRLSNGTYLSLICVPANWLEPGGELKPSTYTNMSPSPMWNQRRQYTSQEQPLTKHVWEKHNAKVHT